VLTCSSLSSRNFSLGVALGQGALAADLLGVSRTVAEGAYTAPVLLAAAQAAGVEMPIVAAVCALIEGEAAVRDVVGTLLARPLRAGED
jgi:glycerol-3-phosphate dehydrogenase (NAD(P)+)